MMSLARVILLGCSLLLLACSPPEYSDTEGNSGHFSDHHGKWLIINYWAIWCKPCIAEIPELNRFAAEHKDKAHLVTVNYDLLSGEELAEQAAKLGIEVPVLTTDPAELLDYPRPTRLPTTIIISPQGKLTEVREGLQTEASLLAAISSKDNSGKQP